MDLKVIDNFLPSYQFKSLETVMMGEDFPWYFKPYIAYRGEKDSGYQFIHNFLNSDNGPTGISNVFHLMNPFKELGKMYRIKANLRTKTLFHRRSYYHIDGVQGATRTSIFYMNTCNGYTKFRKSGMKIKTVANRLVIFDPELEHAAFSQTDEKSRVVINFNYESN